MSSTTPAEILIRHVQAMIQESHGGIVPTKCSRRLCELASSVCNDSFSEVAWLADAGVVGMMVRHPALTQYRTIEAMYFAGVALMCLVGGRINNVPTNPGNKTYSYLRLEHPDDISKRKRVRLNRIVTDAPRDRDVKFVGDHHSYCTGNLIFTKARSRDAGVEDDAGLGREDAIQLIKGLELARTSSESSAELVARSIRDVFVAAHCAPRFAAQTMNG